jgi:hypothetical protein
LLPPLSIRTHHFGNALVSKRFAQAAVVIVTLKLRTAMLSRTDRMRLSKLQASHAQLRGRMLCQWET